MQLLVPPVLYLQANPPFHEHISKCTPVALAFLLKGPKDPDSAVLQPSTLFLIAQMDRQRWDFARLYLKATNSSVQDPGLAFPFSF
jgi:hypothetical protein